MKTAQVYLFKNLTEHQVGSIPSRILNNVISAMKEYGKDAIKESIEIANEHVGEMGFDKEDALDESLRLIK